MADRRERNHQWWTEFDPERMKITFEGEDGEVIVPAKWEVCGTCDGKGSHINPSIDSHGLSREDFDEDPDFAEAYHRGDYDQPCNECNGRTTVPVVDLDRCTETERWQVEEVIESHYSYLAECEAERRMGA